MERLDDRGIKCGSWLTAHKDSSTALCNVCKKPFHIAAAGFGAVKSHFEGKKHKDLIGRGQLTPQVVSFFHRASTSSVSTTDMAPDSDSDRVMRAELRLALHFAEHNISFAVADHSNLYSAMFTDSRIAKDMKCKSNKISYLLNDAIGPYIREELVGEINNDSGLYSLSIDESTDVLGTRKFLQIMVCFLSMKYQRIITCSLKTIEIPDGTAETLEKNVIQTLLELQLSLKKCVSIMSDGPSVMVGRLSGFHVRMQKHAPHLLQLPTCTLHRISNAVRSACECLGKFAEELADNVFAYFHHSTRWTEYRKLGANDSLTLFNVILLQRLSHS